MLDKIRNTIKKYSLFEKGDGVVIGLSGGADSVCLTHALHSLSEELGITVYTAHMNHCLRGNEADRDECFADSFSKKLGIECIIERAQVKTYAEMNGVSEEMAGRELRYAFFERIKKEYKLTKIATAHNKNDSAETILMNFMRGSGLSGLCGIPFKRGDIVRPLLEVSRGEIEDYCRKNGLEYVTDRTNNETVYTRNKIRLDLIPAIQRDFNPGFADTVTKNAALLSEELDYIETSANELCALAKDGAIELDTLTKAHVAIRRRVIIKMMKSAKMRDISSEYVESVLTLADRGRTGASIDLPDCNKARIEYGKLIIGKQNEESLLFEYAIPLNEEVYIRELDITVKAELASGDGVFKGNADSKILIRNRRNGDCFYPTGMDGRKKLKNYFIDEKIPRAKRLKTGLLTIDNEIAWVIGKRRDKRFISNDSGIKITLK